MQIFAHRGASAHAPENTLLAFELAVQQQADGIELDVYQHGEEFLVLHDSWLQRTTNGRGHMCQFSLTQLRQLDAGNGQPIPTLHEAMQTIDGRCQLNIEIKGADNPALLLDYVEQRRQQCRFSQNDLLYSSFDHPLLKQLKALQPGIKIGALTASKPLAYAEFAQQLDAYSIHTSVDFLDQRFAQDAKQRGLKLFVYTVDEKQDLLRLRDWGVDGVFSNDPANARNLLA